MIVGIVHPGAMGSAVGRCLRAEVVWASQGRSAATAGRAKDSGFRDLGDMSALATAGDVIISICPPAAAESVAAQVSATGFEGIYVDANAIAPGTSRRIASHFANYVDGGIVGGPPSDSGNTRLYLSGSRSHQIASLFEGSDLDARAIGSDIGMASAVKTAYAGWTKGSSALLLNQAAYAHSEGVLEILLDEFDDSLPGLPDRLQATAQRVGFKAWRFVGEMTEIAIAMGDRGLPTGFHEGAESVYEALEDLKDRPGGQEVVEILARIAKGQPRE